MPAENQRLILCGGLQSGGTTIVSYCFLQRGDTNGVLDMVNSVIDTDFSAVKEPTLWVKMTIGAFRFADVFDTYRDLGYRVAPLLVVREVRTAFASLVNKDYGQNGTTAEDPPLRMRFRRYLADWELFRRQGWPIIRFEDFVADHRTTLQYACQAVGLAWDEAMVSWPKELAEIACVGETNRTFARTIGDSLDQSLQPASARIKFDNLPLSELQWLETTFAEYNRVHGYPLTLEHPKGDSAPPTLAPPSFEVTGRKWFLDEVKKLYPEPEAPVAPAPARKDKLRIVVLGMFGRCPFGGQTWLYLNWVRAFASLGHEVWYVEDDLVWPYDPAENRITDNYSYGQKHIQRCMERIGLGDRWALRLPVKHGAVWGLSQVKLQELYSSCDLLLNIVGATELRDEHMVARRRIYVETDPVTAELRMASGDAITRELYARHHQFITFGENYGNADCGVPLCGIPFGKIRQPIDLELWPNDYRPNAQYFTTIGNYRQDGSDVEYNGQVYRWSKHWEWDKFIDLPQRSGQQFEICLKADDPADRARLESHGWRLTSPLPMSLDIFGAYPEYFRASRGEFTVAKDQNVRLRSGWFSERDACYLASGKPIVVQDTGFSNVLPTGEGLFAFRTMDEAVAGVEAINRDYPRHCRAARAIAEEYFSAPKIGKAFLEQVQW